MTEAEQELVRELEEAMASLVPEGVLEDFFVVTPPLIDREAGEFFVRDLFAALGTKGGRVVTTTIQSRLATKVKNGEYGKGKRSPDDGGYTAMAYWKIKDD